MLKTRWGKAISTQISFFFAVWLVFLFFFTLKIKKLHEVSKALEKSFKMRPIPLLYLNSFGYSIEKSARGSKIGIAKE